MDVGRLGVWSGGLRQVDDPAVLAAAAEIESLGYGAIWFPAGNGDHGFEVADALLSATEAITVATGITSIWATTAQSSNRAFDELEEHAPGRFLLGVGASHAPLVDRGAPNRYQRPLQHTAEYLDALTVPRSRRVVAALGPKMLDLAKAESLGTHPYLVTPELTRQARNRIGAGPLVAVEQGVILETDPVAARAIARENLTMYLRLPNYVNNWLRTDFTDADVRDGGSDRLIDSLVAWGDAATVAARVHEHYTAGADHICVQVLGGDAPVPLVAWRAIAAALS